jgi:hypothetical protein
MGEDHESRALGQADVARRFRVRIDLVRSEPFDEVLGGLGNGAPKPHEIVMGERDPMTPATIAAAVAREVEVLEARHQQTGITRARARSVQRHGYGISVRLNSISPAAANVTVDVR